MTTSTTHHAHWPTGLPYSLDYPEVPVGAVLAGSARRYGDRVALHYYGREITYAQLWRYACQFANGLRARGVGRGDVVAIHLPNCPQFPIAYYGTLLAGATFSPVNPLLPPDDLAFQLSDCQATVVVSHDLVAASVAGVREQTNVHTVAVTSHDQSLDPEAAVDVSAFGAAGVDFERLYAGQPDTAPDTEVDIHRDLAHLAYTGGTTGRSKGVRLSHRNVVVNTLQYACWGSGSLPGLDSHGGVVLDQVGDEEEFPVRLGTGVVINVTPWFHAMGTIGYLNNLLLGGATIVIHPRFDPVAYLADTAEFRATAIGGAPPLFAALLARQEIDELDFSSVRGISSGAAPLAVELLEELQRRFPNATIGEGYGLTEVTMGALANPANRSGLRKVGTVGIPVFDTEVKIVSPDGGDEPLPPETEGEVCLRGPQVMAGYHERPEETAAVLVDGWLHTGDVGVLDEDGFLRIVDRKKDMLIYKGYNVYPRDLEELLYTHPAVAQAAVVGRPDARVGELPVAFVVRAESAQASAEELIAYVDERVVPYKRLREVHFIESLPVSAAGKVLKRELRESL